MREGSEASRGCSWGERERRVREKEIPGELGGSSMRAREEGDEVRESKMIRGNGREDLTSESRIARSGEVSENVEEDRTVLLVGKERRLSESRESSSGDEGFERSIDGESGSK